MSAAEAEWAILNPASARQPAKISPSAKFAEQPKLLTKTLIVLHHGMLDAVTRNKKIKFT
jgi:hypothetical protein